MLGIEQSRRDDMEALGYMLLRFIKGTLPWNSGEEINNKAKDEWILKKKLEITLEELCKKLPIEFANYMHYVKSLRFEDRPDYSYLRRIFKELLYRENEDFDFIYDWMLVDVPRKSVNDKYNVPANSIALTNEKPPENIKTRMPKKSNTNVVVLSSGMKQNDDGLNISKLDVKKDNLILSAQLPLIKESMEEETVEKPKQHSGSSNKPNFLEVGKKPLIMKSPSGKKECLIY
jgi:transcriptional regulator with XRE-family HTH domain